ncbi:MAG: ADP/ATP-dependent (S)-NAD(P)H-hydrate dehydratase [Thermomicrobiales bacterium]
MTAPKTIDMAMAKSLLPHREAGAHKWGVGGVLVVAGSPMYPGAAWLASRAASRAGAGIVILASGRGVIGTLAGSIPEVAHVILPESDSQSGSKRTLELVQEKLEKVKAVVIGPGLGDDESAAALLGTLLGHGRTPTKARENIGFGIRHRVVVDDNGSIQVATPENETATGALFAEGSIPVVIDADALNWLAQQDDWWTGFPKGQAVLTPHVGELARLLDLETSVILGSPQQHAEEAAKRWSQIVVLKAGRTFATDGETTVIAETESHVLATAGSGDVFAGTIGALLAQGLAPLDAATLAIYIGTTAAATLAETFGESGVIASDIPDAIARATHNLAS